MVNGLYVTLLRHKLPQPYFPPTLHDEINLTSHPLRSRKRHQNQVKISVKSELQALSFSSKNVTRTAIWSGPG